MQASNLHIHPDFAHKDLLVNFLHDFEPEQLSDSLIFRNTRNSIYQIELVPGEELIFKLSKQDPKYSLSRKISFYLRSFFKNYAKRAYNGALLLQEANISGLKPIAYLKFRQNFFLRNSCFVYHSVNTECSLLDMYNETENDKEKHRLIDIIAAISKRLRDNDIIHGDLVLTNFLKTADALDQSSFTLIDTDGTHRNRYSRANSLTAFFADFAFVRSFRRGNLTIDDKIYLLKKIFDKEDISRELKLLKFHTWLDTRPVSRLRRSVVGYIKGQSKALLRV